ncbi:MAG: hypothetical protein V9E82_12910 [Candidatus Nanopelagicales bacterium]
MAIVPKGFAFQPVNSGEVASRLISITEARLTGRRPDFGGPRTADIADWMRLYLATIESRKGLVNAPVPGRIGRGFREGRNTVKSGDRGSATFEEFLRAAR